MSSDLYRGIKDFPYQKRPDSQKTDSFYKECADAAEKLCFFVDPKISKSVVDMQVNYDLWNDILDENDIKKVTNPFKIAGATFPAKMQNYPLAVPKLSVLIGEESERRFSWRVRVGNDDAISEKESKLKDQLFSKVQELITNESLNKEEIQKRLTELEDWRRYEYQDLREIRATWLLNHLWEYNRLGFMFNNGFKDALIAAKEIYAVEMLGDEVKPRRVNPKNIFTLRSGESPFIEDSDIIIEIGYESVGNIIDNYFDELTPSEVKKLDRGLLDDGEAEDGEITYPRREILLNAEGLDGKGSFTNASNINHFGVYDEEGNVRVMRVVWKGKRKLLKVYYPDEFGNEQMEYRSENYKPDELKGEYSEEIWVNEWMQVHKIGKDIYLKKGPLPRIGGSLDNPSRSFPPYCGASYNVNDSKAISMMDRVRPWQYLYNAIMYRTELAISKNLGKIAELDLSKVPDNWSIDKWMYYAVLMGFAVVDPFKEGKKGAAMGKLSGNFNTTGKTLDLETGQHIQNNIALLQFIEQQVANITGVSKQREGQVHQSETAGGIERSVTQSSYITKPWFTLHDEIKLRTLRLILETAKYVYRNKSKKLQYISNDFMTKMFEIDGDELSEADYDIHITDSSKELQLFQALQQLAQAGLQNEKLNFTQIMDIYTTDSVSSMRRKIQKFEQETIERQEQARKEELESRNNEIQSRQLIEQEKLDREDMNKDLDRRSKELIAQMQIDAQKEAFTNDTNSNWINDEVEYEMQQEKLKHEKEITNKELFHDAKEREKDRQVKLQEAKIKAAAAKAKSDKKK